MLGTQVLSFDTFSCLSNANAQISAILAVFVGRRLFAENGS